MSAIATVAGLIAVSTVAAVVFVMSLVDGQSTANSTNLNGIQNNSQWIDPNGPSVQFVLFTRNNGPVNMKIGNEAEFKKSKFNLNHPTKIIIHGFSSSTMEEFFILLRDAYLQAGDFNVIGLDWSVLCKFEYLSAMTGVREAGQYLADFIKWLKTMGVSLDDIHLIGHSMGAHVAGVGAGKMKNGKVGRITGLDPAKPGYRDNRWDNKLDAGDASLVEGVHTFIRVLGLPETVGHVDFYPNGGIAQPGCPDLGNIWSFGESLFCHHGRAYEYFAESIKNKKAFKSVKCSSIQDAVYSKCKQESDVYMGQLETYGENGIYYFKTSGKPPYSL